MKVNVVVVVTAAVLIAAGNVFANTNSAEVVEIADGGLKWRFVPVEGTSQLPLEFMRTGENREKREPTAIDRYWIAEKMVTEGEFAAVTGRKVRDGRSADQVLSDIEWSEGFGFCRRFNAKYRKQMPKGFMLSMPTMIDWAHAVEVLKGKVDLRAEAGTMIFTSSVFGGFLHAPCASDAERDLAIDLGCLTRHGKSRRVGLRPVLVPMAGKVLGDKRIVTNCQVLMRTGFYDEANELLKLALGEGGLNSTDEEWAKGALEYASGEHGHYLEDWAGLVLAAASFAEKRGFQTKPFADGWSDRMLKGSEESADIAAKYKEAGIVGEWRRIGDLPQDVRKGQVALGDKSYILMQSDDGMKPYPYEYDITESNLVQVLRCDFTGDGREDMVVENYCSAGSGGYYYAFYEAKGDGVYSEVEEVQLVGLCVLPRKTGKGCGFIVIGKISNPVLSASLYVYKNGKLECEDVAEKPFYMLDAEEDRIYMMAPFIGAGYGIGWRILEGRGIWFRPVYWPWKQGEVQGYREAVKKAQEALNWK